MSIAVVEERAEKTQTRKPVEAGDKDKGDDSPVAKELRALMAAVGDVTGLSDERRKKKRELLKQQQKSSGQMPKMFDKPNELSAESSAMKSAAISDGIYKVRADQEVNTIRFVAVESVGGLALMAMVNERQTPVAYDNLYQLPVSNDRHVRIV